MKTKPIKSHDTVRLVKRNPAKQFKSVDYPHYLRWILYIPGSARRISEPSTVSWVVVPGVPSWVIS